MPNQLPEPLLKVCFGFSIIALVGGIAQLALTTDYVFGGFATTMGLIGCISYSLSRQKTNNSNN